MAKLQRQWDRIWIIRSVNTDDIIVKHLWIEVLKYKNAAKDPILDEFARFALSMLSLPLSNASVEQMFS